MPLAVTTPKTKTTASNLARAVINKGWGRPADAPLGSGASTSSTTLPRPTAYSTSGPGVGPTGLDGPYRPSGSNTTGTRPSVTSGIKPIGAVNPMISSTNTTGTTPSSGVTLSAAQQASGGVPSAGGQGGFRRTDDPITGWLADMGYTPADVMAMNQMPSRYLYDMLSQQGLTGPNGTPGGLFYMMEPWADALMPLYELMNGTGTKTTAGFSPESIGNFMGYQWDQMMTPGGRLPSMQGLINNLLGTTDQSSVLGSYLNGGAPEEQVENLRRYAMLIAQMSGSQMLQGAYSNALSAAGYPFLQGFQGGQMPDQTFNQSLVNDYGGMFGFR